MVVGLEETLFCVWGGCVCVDDAADFYCVCKGGGVCMTTEKRV